MRLHTQSFAEKYKNASALIYDVRLTLNDEARYFIINVNPNKHLQFKRAIAEDMGFRLDDFGEILHRGWGEPENDIKQLMHAQYGMYADEV